VLVPAVRPRTEYAMESAILPIRLSHLEQVLMGSAVHHLEPVTLTNAAPYLGIAEHLKVGRVVPMRKN